jgi:NAD(P)-dependent dehydrogenase (short-subunit alcohol dehydrogenase family)
MGTEDNAIKKSIDFTGRVVIVTGGGGALGRAYALEIARRGAAVVVNDSGGDVDGSWSSRIAADRVADEVRALGGQAIANYDSVVTAGGAESIANAALDAFGRIDALINNAGNMRIAPLDESREEDFQSLLAVHLLGSYHATLAVWPRMKQQGYGRVVFTASSAGMFGNEGQGCYGAAKAGVFGLMNGFALEGESHGILCNAIMPNAFSRMTDSAQQSLDPAAAQRAAALVSQLQNSMQPEFCAGLASYLASERCRSTHGAYSACAGRIGRVFVGVTDGWQGSRQSPASAEDIAANFEQICDLSPGVHIPLCPADEYRGVLSRPDSTREGTK